MMKILTERIVLPLFLLIAMTLIGCGGDSDQSQSRAGSDDPGEPTRGGRLVVAVQADAKSLDPHRVSDAASYRMIENLYGTLRRQTDEYGLFEPDLATSIEVSEDGLTYTIQVREGVTFHSGQPVTAEDVKYSILRIRDEGVRSSHFAAVESIETPNEQTVVLRLREPSSPLMTHFGHPMNAIVEKAVVEKNEGRLDRVAAGSGPFRLVEWQNDRQLKLARFEQYHLADRPYLDELIYRPMPQEMNRLNALRTGQVDLVVDVSPRVRSVIEQDNHLRMRSVSGTFWEYVGINTAREPFDDVRVRRAIALAIDRKEVNQLARFDSAYPLPGGHLPPGHWAAMKEAIYPEVDREQARALLAEAGITERLSAEVIVGSDFDYQLNAAQVIKQQLEPIGIDLTIKAMPSTSFFDALNRHDFDLTVVGWVGLVDPDEWTYDLFHSEGRFNQQQYRNPELDRLLEKGRQAGSRDQRGEIYQQAQRIIAEEAPVISLYVNDQTSAWREDVHDFVVHPTASTLSLRETWVNRE